MQISIRYIILAVVLVQLVFGARPSSAVETVNLEVPFVGTLSFELPTNYYITNMGLGKVEGPLIKETLIKNDGTQQTYQNTPDYFNFLVTSLQPGGLHPDLMVFVQGLIPDFSQQNPDTNENVTVPGRAGIAYPGYFASFTTGNEYTVNTSGYLAILVEDGWVVSLNIYYFVQRKDTTSAQGNWRYTVEGQPLIPKHQADLTAMIASVRIISNIQESNYTPVLIPETTTFTPLISPPAPIMTSSISAALSAIETSPFQDQSLEITRLNAGEIFFKDPNTKDWELIAPEDRTLLIKNNSAILTKGGTLRIPDLPNPGDSVFIDQNTELQITNRQSRFDLIIGHIRIIMKTLSPHEPEFMINTPICSSGIRGTDLLVDTTLEQTAVLVFEGTVAVSDQAKNKTVLIVAGESSAVKKGGVPSEPQRFVYSDVKKYRLLFDSEDQMKAAAGKTAQPAEELESAGVPVYLLALIVIAVVLAMVLGFVFITRRRRRT
jgi:hypothetical protein